MRGKCSAMRLGCAGRGWPAGDGSVGRGDGDRPRSRTARRRWPRLRVAPRPASVGCTPSFPPMPPMRNTAVPTAFRVGVVHASCSRSLRATGGPCWSSRAGDATQADQPTPTSSSSPMTAASRRPSEDRRRTAYDVTACPRSPTSRFPSGRTAASRSTSASCPRSTPTTSPATTTTPSSPSSHATATAGRPRVPRSKGSANNFALDANWAMPVTIKSTGPTSMSPLEGGRHAVRRSDRAAHARDAGDHAGAHTLYLSIFDQSDSTSTPPPSSTT